MALNSSRISTGCHKSYKNQENKSEQRGPLYDETYKVTVSDFQDFLHFKDLLA